jgi:hypothetical protein
VQYSSLHSDCQPGNYTLRAVGVRSLSNHWYGKRLLYSRTISRSDIPFGPFCELYIILYRWKFMQYIDCMNWNHRDLPSNGQCNTIYTTGSPVCKTNHYLDDSFLVMKHQQILVVWGNSERSCNSWFKDACTYLVHQCPLTSSVKLHAEFQIGFVCIKFTFVDLLWHSFPSKRNFLANVFEKQKFRIGERIYLRLYFWSSHIISCLVEINIWLQKVKGKFNPAACHEIIEGSRGIALLFL